MTETITTPNNQSSHNLSRFKLPLVVLALLLLSVVSVYLFLSNNGNDGNNSNPAVSEMTDTNGQEVTNDNRLISLSEVQSHNTKETCWTVIEGGVYDLTDFVSKHKGGDKILAACGIDATDLFTGKSPMGRLHSQMARTLLAKMRIGVLQ